MECMEYKKLDVVLSDQDYLLSLKQCEEKNKKKEKISIILVILGVVILFITGSIAAYFKSSNISIFAHIIFLGDFIALMWAKLLSDHKESDKPSEPDQHLLLSYQLQNGYNIIDVTTRGKTIKFTIENIDHIVSTFVLENIEFIYKTDIKKPCLDLNSIKYFLPYINYYL